MSNWVKCLSKSGKKWKKELKKSSSYLLIVEPSDVQVLKNPNPLKDVEASAVLDVVVLV